jgi:signal transduction histidine kinase
MVTETNMSDPGMELHDLLSDREFLDRRDGSERSENRFEALQVLARVFVEAPEVVLQKLVEAAVKFCAADSAGISLEETDEHGELRFRWVAISGTFSQYLNGTTPRFFSPCGTCLSTGRPQHYRVTKPYYDFLGVVADPINDGLLIPWNSDESRGTIWAISHGSSQTFGLEDYKLLNTLADFASISVRLTERERRTTSLRQLSADLMRIQDDERRKIARELHDSIGQYLAAIQMNLDQLAKSPSKADEIAVDTRQLVNQCVSETRTISYLLHPPLLNEFGLRSAAKWYVEGFSKRSGIEVALQIDEGWGRLDQDVELALFRALQESLNNVHRHSGSKKVEIVFRLDGGKALVRIRDYGRGLSPQQLRDINNSHGRGVGLTGLRERIAAFGGLFEIAAGQPGTLINITLPTAHGQRHEAR